MTIRIIEQETEKVIAVLENEYCLPNVGEDVVVTATNNDRLRVYVTERVFGVYKGANITAYDVTLWVEIVE